MAQLGTGATITFDSGFFAEILSIDMSFERPAIDTTHTGTTGARSSLPGSLIDGSMDVEIAFAPETAPPYDSAEESITVTLNSAGVGGTSTWVANGYMTSFAPSIPLEERATAVCGIKFTTKPVITP